jgi:hypothetical protein
MVPCMGALSASPEAADPARLAVERFGARFAPALTGPLAAPKPAGSVTSSRLPLISTTTRSRSPGSASAWAAPVKAGS